MKEQKPSKEAIEWANHIGVEYITFGKFSADYDYLQAACALDDFAAVRIAEAVGAEQGRLASTAHKKYEAHHALAMECLAEKNYDMAHSHRTLATCYAKVRDWILEGGDA